MENFMEHALIEAKKALKIGEVPIGSVFIYNKEIIARGGNYVNHTRNATRHAEMVCIDQVLEYCQKNSLDYKNVFKEISVVVTCEPCIMCSAALNMLAVKEIIYGCANDRFGGVSVLNVEETLPRRINEVRGGVRSEEAMALLKTFYKGENPSAPEKIRKKKS